MTAYDRDIEQEDLRKLLDFVSTVLFSEQAANGFGIVYDWRLLKNPSVSGLVAIARWAAEPERKELFEQRCIACTTCVPPGWKFYATRAAMSAFFAVQPPTCKTLLTTSFEDENATSAVFLPPENCVSESASQRTPRKAAKSEAVSIADDQVRRQKPKPPGCFSCLPFLRKPANCPLELQHRQALSRIEELEKANQELNETCERMQERLALLETAVPWVSAMEKVNMIRC